jgi:imidazolonepropionase-like amidohydrolase
MAVDQTINEDGQGSFDPGKLADLATVSGQPLTVCRIGSVDRA